MGSAPVVSLVVEIAVIFVLILVNGFLAMSELAIVSARKVRLQQLAAKGDAGAEAALRLAEQPSEFLASIQIGITLIGVLAGAFGGASVARVFSAELAQVPVLAPYADAIGLGSVVIAVSFLSLVIGELVPKRLALTYAEGLAKAVARPIGLISFVTRPAVRLLSFCTEALVKLLRLKAPEEPPVTEEEVKIMIEQGAAAGVFEPEEETMMKRVLRLGDQSVGVIMTQRLEVVFLDGDASFEENLARMLETPHSYYPVFRESQDDIVGVVGVKDVMARLAENRRGGDTSGVDLAALMKTPLFVAESMPALNLLESFKKSSQVLAVVVDEYGGTAGVVSLTDVFEAVVGDVFTGVGDEVAGVAVRADGSWLVDGTKAFFELKEMLDLPPEARDADEGDGAYQSVGGFVMHQLRAIPRAGQFFVWRGHRFEVVDMDAHRVDKVLVVPPDRRSPGALPSAEEDERSS
jgi:putative hemolysin